jgi:hypothetical protein
MGESNPFASLGVELGALLHPLLARYLTVYRNDEVQLITGKSKEFLGLCVVRPRNGDYGTSKQRGVSMIRAIRVLVLFMS